MSTAFASVRSERWRRAALGGGVLVAFVLLAVFYSTVASAVDRAAVRRTAQSPVQPSAQRPAQRVAATVPPQAGSRQTMPRNVSYVRPAH